MAPGSIFNEASLGCHKLLEEGANILHDPSNFLQTIFETISEKEQEDLNRWQQENEEEVIDKQQEGLIYKISKQIIAELEIKRLSLQALLAITKLEVSELMSILSILELKGIIKQEWGTYHLIKFSKQSPKL